MPVAKIHVLEGRYDDARLGPGLDRGSTRLDQRFGDTVG